jgi:uracil-DNA glycosylase family 4
VLKHPADSVTTLEQLAARVSSCRLCGRAVTPPPILWARPGQRNLLVGQAPGVLEVEIGLPFAGTAGRTLRRWLAPLGVTDHASFLDLFAVAAVIKCYPGRTAGGRGDRVPSRSERANCLPWTNAALRLLDPRLVVPVGRLAIDDWLGRAALSDVIGERFEVGGRIVVPLPHPSGASSWTNLPAHRELIARAVELIREEHVPPPGWEASADRLDPAQQLGDGQVVGRRAQQLEVEPAELAPARGVVDRTPET